MTKRSEGRRRVRETRAAEMESLEQATRLASSAESDQAEKVRELYGDLPEKDQQALFLRFHQELDFSELGKAMGTNQRTAQKRVYRAIEKLRQHLSKRGITSSAALIAGGLSSSNAAALPASLHSSIAQTALFQAAATPAPALFGWFTNPTVWLSTAAVIGTATAVTSLHLTDAKPSFIAPEPAIVEPAVALQGQRPAKSTAKTGVAIDDIEAIYRLPHVEKQTAIDRLSAHLETQNDLSYLEALFQRWTVLDHRRCLDAIMDLFERTEDETRFVLLSECLATPIQHWQTRDPSELLTWLSQTQRTQNGEPFAFVTVIGTMGQEDLPAAFRLLAERGATGQGAYDRLAQIIAKDGVEAAWTAFAELPSPSKASALSTSNPAVAIKDAGLDPKARLVAATVPYLFEQDPRAIADWIVELPNSTEGNAFTRAFVTLWAASDPRAAATWTEELPTESRNVVAPALAETWATHEPRTALDWIIGTQLTERPFKSARPAFARWTQDTPLEAIAWLNQHVESPEAAPLFGNAADSLETDIAPNWARELPQSTNRRRALQHAFYAHARIDPAKAREQLREIVPTQAQVAATRAWAQGIYTSAGRQALSQWRLNEEDAGNEHFASMIQAAEVNILAAINPTLVSSTILTLPPSDHKDTLVHELIDRTYLRSREHAMTAKQWLSELRDTSKRKTWATEIDQTIRDQTWETPKELPVQRTGGLNTQSYGEFADSLSFLATLPRDL